MKFKDINSVQIYDHFLLGSTDKILGVDRLKQHNPITFDYQDYKIIITKDGLQVNLHGDMARGTLQAISGKGMHKLLKSQNISQGCICLVTADPISKDSSPVIPPVQTLLSKYQIVFSEPQDLPPMRSQDHKIPLPLSTSEAIEYPTFRNLKSKGK